MICNYAQIQVSSKFPLQPLLAFSLFERMWVRSRMTLSLSSEPAEFPIFMHCTIIQQIPILYCCPELELIPKCNRNQEHHELYLFNFGVVFLYLYLLQAWKSQKHSDINQYHASSMKWFRQKLIIYRIQDLSWNGYQRSGWKFAKKTTFPINWFPP